MADTIKALRKSIAPGRGTTTGYTEEGQVFFVTDTEGPDKAPMQVILMWTPEFAEQLATSIVKAAAEAKKHLESNQNGRPDSNRAH